LKNIFEIVQHFLYLMLPPPQASLGLLQRERESERKESGGKADGKAARE
jgi:hypothetical protein